MWGVASQENRVVLPTPSRTGHLQGLDSFPDIVPLTRRKVAACKLLPTTHAPSLKYPSQKKKKKKEREHKATTLGTHCTLCFQWVIEERVAACIFQWRVYHVPIRIYGTCQLLQSYFLDTLIQLPIVKGPLYKERLLQASKEAERDQWNSPEAFLDTIRPVW